MNNTFTQVQLMYRIMSIMEDMERSQRDYNALQSQKLRIIEQILRSDIVSSRPNNLSETLFMSRPSTNTPPPSVNSTQNIPNMINGINSNNGNTNESMNNINDFLSNVMNETINNESMNPNVQNQNIPDNNQFFIRYTTMLPFINQRPNSNVRNNGLTREQIRESTTNSTFENAENPLNIEECLIRHESFEPNTRVTRINNCNHIFTTTSILNWLRSHNTCPVCRSAVYPELRQEQQEEIEEIEETEETE